LDNQFENKINGNFNIKNEIDETECEDEDRDMIGLLIRNKCKVCEKYNCDECLSEKCMKC